MEGGEGSLNGQPTQKFSSTEQYNKLQLKLSCTLVWTELKYHTHYFENQYQMY